MTNNIALFGIGVTGIYFLWISIFPLNYNQADLLWFLGVIWTGWGVGVTVVATQKRLGFQILGCFFLVAAMFLNGLAPMFHSKWYDL